MTNKYRAKRTWSELTQRFYDSKAECIRGEELHLLERAGEITDLRYQVRFVLSVNDYKICNYIADFCYLDPEYGRIIEDTKGVSTRVYQIKKKLMKAIYGFDIKETTR